MKMEKNTFLNKIKCTWPLTKDPKGKKCNCRLFNVEYDTEKDVVFIRCHDNPCHLLTELPKDVACNKQPLGMYEVKKDGNLKRVVADTPNNSDINSTECGIDAPVSCEKTNEIVRQPQ